MLKRKWVIVCIIHGAGVGIAGFIFGYQLSLSKPVRQALLISGFAYLIIFLVINLTILLLRRLK